MSKISTAATRRQQGLGRSLFATIVPAVPAPRITSRFMSSPSPAVRPSRRGKGPSSAGRRSSPERGRSGRSPLPPPSRSCHRQPCAGVMPTRRGAT